MSLTMIKLEPDMGRLVRWAERRGLFQDRGEDDLGYVLHAVLAATFAESAPKPFALVEEPRKPVAILAYSASAATALRQLAQAIAEPDTAEAVGLETFSAKVMPDSWVTGQRFGFAVRTRPMLRTDRDGDRNRTKEVDAFVLSPPNSERGEVYAGWLRQQMLGAAIEHVTLESFRFSRVRRRDAARELKGQRGPDARFTGILRVTDGDAFAKTLARGIGRHRTFGFGMLLLKPAR